MGSSFQPWANPDPQAISGLNSAMVYGENIQFATGINHQVALGSNLQLCINPLTLFDLLDLPGSATLAGLWGSGMGGNMQFTIGSSATVTWGRQFDIHMGPDKVELDLNGHRPFSMAMCILIGAASLAYAIGYGLSKDEDDRATIVLMYQLVIDALLGALMTQTMYYKSLDTTLTDGLKKLWAVPDDDRSTTLQDFASGLSAVFLMSAIITPPVLIAREEGHFQGEKQDTSA